MPRMSRNGAKQEAAGFVVEQWPIDRLVGYARNPRRVPEAAIDKLASGIREFGWRVPVIVDDSGTIIAGHTRVAAARRLGMSEVPVHIARDLTPQQVKAYRIFDNRVAQETQWDMELAALELKDLEALSYDLGLTGFEPAELESMLAPEATGAVEGEDDVPDPPEEPVTRAGDLWLLGNHRLLCGDATVATEVERALAGVRPHLMVTDPPYGVEYDPDWRNRADRANGKPYGASAVGKVQNDDKADWREAWALFPGDVAYVWHAGTKADLVAESLRACGFEIRCQIIWAKSRFVISRGHYHVQHEPLWYAVRKTRNGHWAGDRSQSTLWTIDHRKSDTGHGTQKPVECMRRPIVNNSSPGQAVYDPFVGSGTTVIAAETTGRIAHCIDLDPAYCDVTVKRWQTLAGQQATLDGDGRTFDELAAERVPAAA